MGALICPLFELNIGPNRAITTIPIAPPINVRKMKEEDTAIKRSHEKYPSKHRKDRTTRS
jgi:hypothetical protein